MSRSLRLDAVRVFHHPNRVPQADPRADLSTLQSRWAVMVARTLPSFLPERSDAAILAVRPMVRSPRACTAAGPAEAAAGRVFQTSRARAPRMASCTSSDEMADGVVAVLAYPA